MSTTDSPGWRALIGGTILAVQIMAIVYARFVPTRYLSWAPYDEIVFYEIGVQIGDATLNEQEVRDRYRISKWGRSNRSWAHVSEAVAHYETTHGRTEAAQVQVHYTVNGRGPFVWNWPEQHPHDPGAERSDHD